MIELLLGLSLHYFDGFTDRYNFVHPHVRYTHNQIIAGAYYNSIDQISLYGGYEFELSEKDSLELAAVTGYDYEYPIVPMIRYVREVNNIDYFISPTVETLNNETNYGFVIGLEIPIR